MHGIGAMRRRGPGLPVSEEALALLVGIQLIAGVGDTCEGKHGRRGKPSEFGEGNGAEGVATRRRSGSVAGVKALFFHRPVKQLSESSTEIPYARY